MNLRLGLGGVIFVVFLVLKLDHVVGWSWFWVTSPLWIPPALICVALAGAWVIDLFTPMSGWSSRRRRP
jgi:hypothetical protein